MVLDDHVINKLIKIAKLTNSPVAGEGQAASHKLNEILVKNGLSWEEIFQAIFEKKTRESKKINQGKITRESGNEWWDSLGAQEQIDVFEEILDNEWSQFVESLNEFYRKTGFLTKKQADSLERIYIKIGLKS